MGRISFCDHHLVVRLLAFRTQRLQHHHPLPTQRAGNAATASVRWHRVHLRRIVDWEHDVSSVPASVDSGHLPRQFPTRIPHLPSHDPRNRLHLGAPESPPLLLRLVRHRHLLRQCARKGQLPQPIGIDMDSMADGDHRQLSRRHDDGVQRKPVVQHFLRFLHDPVAVLHHESHPRVCGQRIRQCHHIPQEESSKTYHRQLDQSIPADGLQGRGRDRFRNHHGSVLRPQQRLSRLPIRA
mmetsp:Transcript_25758/g.71947  ORF Transcript_25758/g.71947 Transcript_25758/m.71947 type:complete len:239 (+) Transcript_25758:670-1386(+)